VLIFGVGAIDGAVAGASVSGQLMILAAALLVALVLAPFAAAAGLRLAAE
jgi:heme exporter protein B